MQRGGRIKGVDRKGTELSFGEFGIKSLGTSGISSRQIEAARRAMTHYVKRGGKIWIRIFPNKPMTIKGAGMKMGKGKGTVDHYVFVVRPGRILFEMGGVTLEIAKEAMRRASHKLPIKTKFITKQ